MSNTNTDTGHSTAPETASQGTKLERSVQMAFFRDGRGTYDNGKSKTLALEMPALVASAPPGKTPVIRCGVLIGQATGYKRRMMNDKRTGEVRESVLLLGRFRAIRFSDNAVMHASGAYLPSIFLDAAIAQLDSGMGTIEFGIELGVEPDPRPEAVMPYVWTVHNLLHEDKGMPNPLDRLQSMLSHDIVKAPAKLLAQPDVVKQFEDETTDGNVAETAQIEAGKAKAGRKAA